jgi:type VI secretion system protein ImpL
MAGVMRFLGSRWFISFIGTALLAVLVWFFGVFLAILEGWLARLIVIAVMFLIWAGVNFALDRRRRGRDKALTAGATATSGGAAASAGAEEAEAVREKLTSALAMLRKASGARGYLYEQPWYVIIGPPGAGKTTALLNAGLKFPLAAAMGQAAVAGVGGTRLCDWWFTDNAVMIDTAGRYTTQDSDAAVDRAGWDSFLDLLKRTRVRQPLNGVIVAIALSEIATASTDERLAHARAIRRRVKELETRLGMRMPVYALFTKIDLIAGFTEFFDDLDREKRGQVLGTTFRMTAPAAAGDEGAVAQFASEFKLLVTSLNDRLFNRMQDERSPDRRALIAGFPTQFASLEQPLLAFLSEAFGGSRLDRAPLLRGVYFTSGTQDGTPIDRLTGVIGRTFGLDQRRLPSLRAEKGRSYFLTRLLNDVIFGEAMLVSSAPAARRRALLLRIGGFAAVAVLVLLICGLLFASRVGGMHEIAATGDALAAYETTAATIRFDPVADADLPRIAPLLDQARALPHGYDKAAEDGASWYSLGLSQNAKLEAASRAVYRHALEHALLPRLIWRLETQMRGNFGKPDFLYEATRVYLMLGSAGPLDRELIREWMALDWQAAYPGPQAAAFRESLARHLDALLAEPLPPLLLDGELVAQAQATFSRVSLAQRVYSRVKPSAAAQRVPPWRPSDALGPAGVRVFVRPSGKPLTDGVPGFLTPNGFHKVLLPALPLAAKNVASESWVLGKRAEIDPLSPQMKALEHDVIALYTADYIAAWDAMIADIDVVPLRNLQQASQDLYVLSSPQSPIRDLLADIARQVTLSVAPAGPAGAAQAAAGALGAAQGAVTDTGSRLQALLGDTAGAEPAKPPGSEVDAHYKALRDLVGSGPGAPLDLVLKSINDLQQQLAKLAAGPGGGAAPPPQLGVDPAATLRAQAASQPQPLQRWLLAMSTSATSLRTGSAKELAKGMFNGAGGPASLCEAAISGRYPFVRNSANDVPLDDFGKLFAPGALLDGFFNTQLRPYVDMSGRNWKGQAVDGVPAPASPEDIAQFQRAAVIRDLFFAGGGATPSIRFDITPMTLDPGANQVTLDLDGTTVNYAHGPTRATQITWPGANRMQNVRLVFDPAPATGTGVLAETGPWAMFRLFDHGTLQQGASAERYTLTFKLGDRAVSFEIRASSVLNPLAPGILQDFRCPKLG